MKDKIINIIVYFALAFIFVHLGFLFSQLIDKETQEGVFWYTCIFSPIWEEAAFRWAPIEIARTSRNFEDIKWPLIILTSVIFGLIHNGPLSIPIQGVFGLVMSILYIENKFSYFSVVFVHMSWNFLIFAEIMPSI